MKARDLMKLGYKPGKALGVALRLYPEIKGKMKDKVLRDDLRAILNEPNAYKDHTHLALLAEAILEERERKTEYVERDEPAPYRVWGQGLEEGALEQMRNAARLPVSVSGALMPDAHQGYGLPIGGVLATENTVIPYAVGVDIACRMKLSVLDVPADQLKRLDTQLKRALERNTVFGTGAENRKGLEHEVLSADWGVSPITRKFFDKAAAQIGTSGSGNHFVEFGILTVAESGGFKVEGAENAADATGSGAFGELKPGTYLALLSHSGSRGTGAQVADYYSKLAMDEHPELPAELRRLAWLDLDSDAGREYFAAMNLMGRYASANHALIHQRVLKAIDAKAIAGVENHHNFAWKENHNGKDVMVHRKGATPAGKGVLGVIPGSMAAPGFVVRGLGNEASLMSASHGAGRRMSRTAAKEQFRWAHFKDQFEEAGVQLLSAGIDEAPGAYKDIHQVMAAQSDLVEIVARFDPKIVKMAPAGEKPED